MMRAVVYWLLCILLFIRGGDLSLGLNEDANMTVTGSCMDEERQALLIFKADLNGSLNDWSNADEKRNCCKWSGVRCDARNGHVTELDLHHSSLVGNISPSIKLLKRLQFLDLSGNDFQSNPIPNILGSLTNLQYLAISNANLSGDLPNSLGHVSNLEYLDVSHNSLHGVISDLHFENLSRLTYLDMSFNSLAIELSSLFRVPFQLKTIKLQSCMLGPSFPLWIKTQTGFEHLDISSAGISDSVPLWFWDLPVGLKFLNLSSNELRGTLPDITSDFVEYPGMDLSNNHFEGRVTLLPSKLASLKLSGNKFKGDLSFLCHNDGELAFIDLSNNSFSESLPDCWSKFRRLVVLKLSNNNLSGKIPLSFGFLNQLEALYMRQNAFVGELPVSMKDCTNLRFVDLGGNKLSGKIPAWIGESLSELYVLVLRSNMLTGSLPTQICWLHNLQFLDLSKNGLVGNIPRCFDNFTSMSTNWSSDDITSHYYSLYIQNSAKSHSLYIQNSTYYHSVYRQRHLRRTHVTYEALQPNHPAIPDEVFEDFIIDNAWAAWKGTDRSFGSGLKLLKSIDLSSNNFSGNLPSEITRLVELLSLNFSLNKMYGELPKDIGQLRSLDSLDLSRNQFSGRIPSSLSQVHGLGYLDLSFNNFSGRIPLGTQLQSFKSSSYEGNPLLYGPPLTPISGLTPAPTIAVNEGDKKYGDDEFWESYYMGMGTGFAVGFWGLCGVIFLNRRCRHLLFASLSLGKDWIYVTTWLCFFGRFKRF